jgi:SAM-dependent methyltransferase
MANYCAEDWRRFLYTYGLAADLTGDALELGANPYFTTSLLLGFTRLNVRCANYFDDNWPERATQSVVFPNADDPQLIEFSHFNIERERFPFEDERFDVLFFCEILEHLQNDPVACLRECNRILKQHGHLILSTPNVSRLENVARMLAGVNIYDPYSGYGPYGRHNREYNKHELFNLLTACGFEIELMSTADVHENRSDNYFPLTTLIPLVQSRKNDLGQYVFVRATKSSIAGGKRPSWLYRSYPLGELE